MATLPLPRVEILDLQQMRSKHLAALFEEEAEEWRTQLRWDYKPSAGLIRKHIDAGSLPGYVALVDGQVAGYCFFVHDEPAESPTPGAQKGLLGDLYVRRAYRPPPTPGFQAGAPPQAGLATQLVEHALETLETSPGVTRIEAQLMPFGIEPLAPIFLAHDFRSYPRLFMYRDLKGPSASLPSASLGTGRTSRASPAAVPKLRAAGLNVAGGPVAGALRLNSGQATGLGEGGEARSLSRDWQIQGWDDRYFEPLAELIISAYAGHIDSRLNDQYASRAGALKFLKNIVVFPGCGVFQPDVSFVAFADPSGRSPSTPLRTRRWVERSGEGSGEIDPASRFRVHDARSTKLAGGLLVSRVAPRVGHITQVCVRPELQGSGLGRRLLARAVETLEQKGYEGVSLSVTADNHPAVRLYRRFGFEVIKGFAAFVRDKLSAS